MNSARQTLVSLLPAGLSMAWLVAKVHWFWDHQPDLQFGWVVLLLCVYLFWEAWENRPATRLRWSMGWLLLASIGLGLAFVVQIFQAACGTNAASVAGLAIAVMCIVAGNLGYTFGGAGIRHFGFAFAFL